MKIASKLYKSSEFRNRYESLKPKLSRSQIIRNIEVTNPEEAAYLKAELRGMKYEEIPEEDEIAAIQHQYLAHGPSLIKVIKRAKNVKPVPGVRSITNSVMLPLPPRMKRQGTFLENVPDYEGTYQQYMQPALSSTRMRKNTQLGRRQLFDQYVQQHCGEIQEEQEIPENAQISVSNLRLAPEDIVGLGNKVVPRAPRRTRYAEPNYMQYQ
jgi:hypothetical protein